MSARAGKGTGRASVGGELACQAELLFVLVDSARRPEPGLIGCSSRAHRHLERQLAGARLPRVEEWIGYAQPDVLCIQETKQADAAFPHGAFAALGYETAHHGDGRWNGVAIVSRVGLSEDLGRYGIRGRCPGHPADRRRLRWCAGDLGLRPQRAQPRQRALSRPSWTGWPGCGHCSRRQARPDRPVAVCGDFNVAPEDRDVWDPAAVRGHDPREPTRARRPGPPRVVGPGRRVPATLRPRTDCSPGGTTGRASSTSTRGCGSTSSWSPRCWPTGRPTG